MKHVALKKSFAKPIYVACIDEWQWHKWFGLHSICQGHNILWSKMPTSFWSPVLAINEKKHSMAIFACRANFENEVQLKGIFKTFEENLSSDHTIYYISKENTEDWLWPTIFLISSPDWTNTSLFQ